jgi:hypothetical protein
MSILLAEALKRRADLLDSAKDIKARIAGAAVNEMGETPEEDATALLEQYLAIVAEAQDLVRRVNLTNNLVKVHFNGVEYSLMTAVLTRETWKQQAAALRGVIADIEGQIGSGRNAYYGRRNKDEVKMVSVLALKDLRARAESLSAQVSALDMEIQKVNFTAELVAE